VIFLIEYDRERGLLLGLSSFDDSRRQQAEEARLALELRRNQESQKREIVLLEAFDEDAIRRTHRRYFERIQDLGTIPGSNGS